jgi:hypothetical protein
MLPVGLVVLAVSLHLSASLRATGALHAQGVMLQRAENFRVEPNGVLLAELRAGAELDWVSTRDTWVEATMEGWVWSQSLQATDRGGFDLVVSADGGENLRSRPQGEPLGRLAEGTLLEELERIPGWILVRRRGWIWGASVAVDEGIGSGADLPSITTPEVDTPADPTPVAGAPPSGTGARSLPGPTGTPVLLAPGGDTLGVLSAPAELRVLATRDGWARVALEGWVRIPEGTRVDPALDRPSAAAPASVTSSAEAAVAGGLGIEDVLADPVGSRGREVTWELQLLTLERAGALRTDLREGEPYLLMRPAGEGTGRFVYVAIPESRVPEVERITPLERLLVRGIVRMGSSPITSGPILDLVDFESRRGPR